MVVVMVGYQLFSGEEEVQNMDEMSVGHYLTAEIYTKRTFYSNSALGN